MTPYNITAQRPVEGLHGSAETHRQALNSRPPSPVQGSGSCSASLPHTPLAKRAMSARSATVPPVLAHLYSASCHNRAGIGQPRKEGNEPILQVIQTLVSGDISRKVRPGYNRTHIGLQVHSSTLALDLPLNRIIKEGNTRRLIAIFGDDTRRDPVCSLKRPRERPPTPPNQGDDNISAATPACFSLRSLPLTASLSGSTAAAQAQKSSQTPGLEENVHRLQPQNEALAQQLQSSEELLSEESERGVAIEGPSAPAAADIEQTSNPAIRVESSLLRHDDEKSQEHKQPSAVLHSQKRSQQALAAERFLQEEREKEHRQRTALLNEKRQQLQKQLKQSDAQLQQSRAELAATKERLTAVSAQLRTQEALYSQQKQRVQALEKECSSERSYHQRFTAQYQKEQRAQADKMDRLQIYLETLCQKMQVLTDRNVTDTVASIESLACDSPSPDHRSVQSIAIQADAQHNSEPDGEGNQLLQRQIDQTEQFMELMGELLEQQDDRRGVSQQAYDEMETRYEEALKEAHDWESLYSCELNKWIAEREQNEIKIKDMTMRYMEWLNDAASRYGGESNRTAAVPQNGFCGQEGKGHSQHGPEEQELAQLKKANSRLHKQVEQDKKEREALNMALEEHTHNFDNISAQHQKQLQQLKQQVQQTTDRLDGVGTTTVSQLRTLANLLMKRTEPAEQIAPAVSSLDAELVDALSEHLQVMGKLMKGAGFPIVTPQASDDTVQYPESERFAH